MTTYTLDAQTPNGAYASDYGLTWDEVQNAYANAPRLGITILRVTAEDQPLLTPEQVRAAFGL